MSVTSPLFVFGRNALAIKADISSVVSSSVQSFVTLNDLALEVGQYKYITFEPDMWLLDGSYHFMPASPHIGYMSAVQSGSGSSFAVAPTLTITFGSVHSTTGGLTLYFSELTNDYTDSITVAFYDSSNALIRSDTYIPTGTTFATAQAVTSFKKIIFTFNSTNKNYRYARLLSIDFDDSVHFTGADIKDAQLTENIDPVSLELPFDILDMTLFSSDGNFSIVDPVGFYANLQYKDPIDAYEVINDATIYLGRFYLDDWHSESENIADFHAVDLIGIMDKLPYPGGLWIPDIYTASVAFANLFSYANLPGMCSVDTSLASVHVFGYAPTGTYREALQHFCLGVGGYATCARSRLVLIRPFELASSLSVFDYTVTNAEKHLNSPVKLRPLVTGVEMLSHEYIQGAAEVAGTLFDGDLSVGTHIIVFGKPAWGTSETRTGGLLGTTIYDNDFVIATITTAGHLLITGKDYTDNQKVISQYNGGLPANTVSNVTRINDATMANKNNTATLVTNFYNYYQQRYIQETKLFASLIAVGDSVLIDSQASKQIKGIVESMITDLAGGFVSELKIIGAVA